MENPTITKVTAVTSHWFEVRVRYEKTSEDGKQRAVTEQYVVEAMSFTEAEAAITAYIVPYVSGGFAITAITIAPYGEVFFTDDEKADKYFRVKVAFIILDEKTGKEKKTTATYLASAANTEGALRNTDAAFAPTMIDYYVSSITETALLDVVRREAK